MTNLKLNSETAKKVLTRSLPQEASVEESEPSRMRNGTTTSTSDHKSKVQNVEAKLKAAGFQKVGAAVYKAPLANHDYSWTKSLGPRLWENARGTDITVEWNNLVSQKNAVNKLLGALCHSSSATMEIEECMQSFEAFCKIAGIHAVRYTARLVATKGAASTKCPQWHFDHVPVRWIQALRGPGCMWMDDNGHTINWERINALELENECNIDRNKLIVPDESAAKCGVTGEPLLLLGNQWVGSSTPALHKSPANFPPWQRRVLLTMDVHC